MKKLIIFLLQLGTLFYAGKMMTQEGEVFFFLEAEATPQRETAAVQGNCNDTPVTSFTPTLTYTLSFPQSGAAIINNCTISSLLGDVINGDSTSQTGSCNINDTAQVGFAIANARTPTVKIGGLLCSTEDRVILEVNGDASNDPDFDIAFGAPSGNNNWPAGNQVDHNSTKKMLFGPGGLVGTSAIIDGTDNDGIVNGEIAFGGTSAGEGGSKIYTRIDFTNHDVDNSQEILTLTFTPSGP